MTNSFLEKILSSEPSYRFNQIKKAWFDTDINGYDEIITLPAALREKLKDIPWLCAEPVKIVESKFDDAKKTLLKLGDGESVETVLMGRENKKKTRESEERYTVCVSSQAGCAMKCVFCATGAAGFRRNLTAEEIVDQYRFWQKFKYPISNIVVMGQGEPLLNYDNLKNALNTLIVHGEIGPTNVTVSTCGVKVGLERLLSDKNFPQVRWALSLHSAIEKTRTGLMPSHQKGFLEYFIVWANKYHKQAPSRSHFIGLEYVMLNGLNDDERHLAALIKFARQIPRVRVNLIPYNNTIHKTDNVRQDNDNAFFSSPPELINLWRERIMNEGFVCTVRRSQGRDIAAACGQLRNFIPV